MISDTLSERASILLVDADECAATHLRDTLVRSGYAVRLAASAQSAMAALAAEAADLILLDLLLPDADGLIVCRNLSARADAPIILLSARPREVDRVLALDLGASAFAAKPVDACHLLPAIKAALADSVSVKEVIRSR